MAKVEKRKMLDVELNDYIDFDVIDGKTFDQIIEEMQSLKREYTDRDVYFYTEQYGYDGGRNLKLRERRLETDREFEKRMALEKKTKDKEKEAKATKEAREFSEYQRLQKKFQGKTVF